MKYSELAVEHNWNLKTYNRPKQLKSIMTSFIEQIFNIDDIYQLSIRDIQDMHQRFTYDDM